MSLLFISLIVSILILGGPLTLFAIIKISSSLLGGIRPKFVRLKAEAEAPTLNLMVDWDEQSFPEEINRVKVDFVELVRGGRATSFSVTFEDKSAKKRSFLVPIKLKPEELEMITGSGLQGQAQAVKNSYVVVEIENTRGEVRRSKISKKKILNALNQPPVTLNTNEIEVLPATEPDTWSVLTRVFPWRKAVAVAEVGEAKHAAPKKVAKSSAPTLVDFLVTKVWIEPGCIVCDACENEAPAVFKVLADTCIVVENADLSDGASIKAAAEGCPVDVIKYTTVPKTAA